MTVYHVGFLINDRRKDKDLDRRATELMSRATAGEVVLVQRRLADDRYEYLMVDLTTQQGRMAA